MLLFKRADVCGLSTVNRRVGGSSPPHLPFVEVVAQMAEQQKHPHALFVRLFFEIHFFMSSQKEVCQW